MALPFTWKELDQWLEDHKDDCWTFTDRYIFLRPFGPKEGFDDWLKRLDKHLEERNDRIIAALTKRGGQP